MTHSYVRHDSFICATWPIHMCDMTHSYVRHDAFICATWPIHMCDMMHSYGRHDSFICAMWPMHMCDMTHSDRHATHSCIFVCAYVCMHIFTYILHCLIPNSRGDLRSRSPTNLIMFHIHTKRTAGTKRQQWQLIDNNTDDFITSWQNRSRFPIIFCCKKIGREQHGPRGHKANSSITTMMSLLLPTKIFQQLQIIVLILF